MKTSYFLEDFDPNLDLRDKMVISLDPATSYSLGKHGIEYGVIEDYYDEKELRSGEKEYFSEQLRWFADFDDFFKKDIGFCREFNIPMATANYLRLKYCVDTLIIYSRILSYFFRENTQVKEVKYFHKPFIENEKESIFEFKHKNRAVFRDVLKAITGNLGIIFSEGIAAQGNVSALATIGNEFIKAQIKKVINTFKYSKTPFALHKTDSLKDMNILLLHAGSYDIDHPMRIFLKNGANVYVREKGRMLHENNFHRLPAKMTDANPFFKKTLLDECYNCAQSLKSGSRIVNWVNDKCDMDVSPISLRFLSYFICRDCPEILGKAKEIFDFYKCKGIDYVFARGNTDRDSVACLIAAKYMKGAKSVCTEHTSFAIDMEVMGVFETETYDYTFVRDSISEGYFKRSLDQRYRTQCALIQSPYYLKNIESRYRKTKKRDFKNTIVYIEKKFSDRVRCFNNMNYPLAWYFEFQKKVIDFFGKEKDFIFLYKHAKSQLWAQRSILKYIHDKRYRNIAVVNGHFSSNVLKRADRVIVDYPSGALFESAAAGKPVLCVYADYFRIIKEAIPVFGKSLRCFSSTDEALAIMREFLYAPRKDYMVRIPFVDDEFKDTFDKVVGRQERAYQK